nr:unnamed protein product [Spirometra erinaceieuropaei]
MAICARPALDSPAKVIRRAPCTPIGLAWLRHSPTLRSKCSTTTTAAAAAAAAATASNERRHARETAFSTGTASRPPKRVLSLVPLLLLLIMLLITVTEADRTLRASDGRHWKMPANNFMRTEVAMPCLVVNFSGRQRKRILPDCDSGTSHNSKCRKAIQKPQ